MIDNTRLEKQPNVCLNHSLKTENFLQSSSKWNEVYEHAHLTVRVSGLFSEIALLCPLPENVLNFPFSFFLFFLFFLLLNQSHYRNLPARLWSESFNCDHKALLLHFLSALTFEAILICRSLLVQKTCQQLY